MRDILEYLRERKDEFERHLFIARMLEARIDELVGEEGHQVEVRHVNTIKSGLLIHLYNIVEAVTTRTLGVVGATVVAESPKRWTQSLLKEWVRAAIWSGEDRISDGALNRLAEVSGLLVSGDPLTSFAVKGEPGSWDDKAIKKVAERLGCRLLLSEGVKEAAYTRKYRDQTTAMKHLAVRRNQIAHGETTFEEGANDLTLNELSELANRVLPFLKEVTESYQTFLNDKDYLASIEAAA